MTGRAKVNYTLAMFALFFAIFVTPLMYGVAVALTYGISAHEVLKNEVSWNIALNSAANLFVMILSIGLKGRFDRKLASVVSRTLLVHGSLAFFILVTRQNHSNQIMLMGVAVSTIIGAAMMFEKHRQIRPRVAVIGAWHPLIEQVGINVDWVKTPGADLSGYDILLTSCIVELSTDWTSALSRAMLMGRPVRHLAEFVEEVEGKVSLDHFELEHITANGLKSYRARKRIFDLIIFVVALPLILIVLIIAIFAILATMGRPIFFTQERVGLGGKSFRMYKLRSMKKETGSVDKAEATKGPLDDRVTPTGRFLRRFRIDELPQLWHVLTGEMSVIGPRPEWKTLNDQYSQALPAYVYRNLVRPGMTGWAQVRGGYAADLAETKAKLGYDLFYVKNFSFALDVHILVRTVWTLMTGSGAR